MFENYADPAAHEWWQNDSRGGFDQSLQALRQLQGGPQPTGQRGQDLSIQALLKLLQDQQRRTAPAPSPADSWQTRSADPDFKLGYNIRHQGEDEDAANKSSDMMGQIMAMFGGTGG